MIQIRPAELRDREAIAALSAELGYPVDPDAFAGRLARCLQSAADLVMVAETSRGLVGWIHAGEREYLESGRQCEILGLVVSAAVRRHGVGRRLVDAVERWTSDRGGATLTVRSNVVRPESHPFYQRLGYERVKTQHVYRKPLSGTGDGTVASHQGSA